MINGKTSREESFTYTYILEGTKEGVYEIPAATIVIDGKKYSSNTLKIEVIKGSDKSASNQVGQSSASARTEGTTAVATPMTNY